MKEHLKEMKKLVKEASWKTRLKLLWVYPFLMTGIFVGAITYPFTEGLEVGRDKAAEWARDGR